MGLFNKLFKSSPRPVDQKEAIFAQIDPKYQDLTKQYALLVADDQRELCADNINLGQQSVMSPFIAESLAKTQARNATRPVI